VNTDADFGENLVAFLAKGQEVNTINTLDTIAQCQELNIKLTLCIMHGYSIHVGLAAVYKLTGRVGFFFVAKATWFLQSPQLYSCCIVRYLHFALFPTFFSNFLHCSDMRVRVF
jgi:hypothetical protein